MPPLPSNVTTTAGSGPILVTSGSAVLTGQEREYAIMRWRVCMTELRYWADLLGWADRLPDKRS